MTIQILCIVIAIILLRWSSTEFMLNKNMKKFFRICIFLLLLVSFSEIGCKYFDNTTPENRVWSILFNILGFGSAPFIFLFEGYCYDEKSSKLLFIPGIVNLMLSVLSAFYNLIFFVEPNCDYSRGPLFIVFIIVCLFYIIFALIKKLRSIKYYPSFFKTRIISTNFLLIFGLSLQVYFPGVLTSWIIVSSYFALNYALSCEISSMVDGLTGLMNKSVFKKQMLDIQENNKRNIYLLMIDVNNFKEINDKHGHVYGDQVLIEIATVIRDLFNQNANVYRFGGDEFCVILEAESKKEVNKKIALLHEKLSEKRSKTDYFPYLAIGYEKFNVDVNVQRTIDLADEKMYKQKEKMKARLSEEQMLKDQTSNVI